MSTDKRQLGLNPSAQRVSEELVSSGLFKDGIATGRFGLAVAVREEVEVGRAEGTTTKWHTGDLDPTGEMAAVVGAIYPSCQEEPYRQVEYLINRGLEIIGDRTRAETTAEGKTARRLPDVMALLNEA
jgi:hypothetical protein